MEEEFLAGLYFFPSTEASVTKSMILIIPSS